LQTTEPSRNFSISSGFYLSVPFFSPIFLKRQLAFGNHLSKNCANGNWGQDLENIEKKQSFHAFANAWKTRLFA